MRHVVLVGSLNADLVVRLERFPASGETGPGTDFAIHPGGKGANHACAAAKLGARVFMVGRVGRVPHLARARGGYVIFDPAPAYSEGGAPPSPLPARPRRLGRRGQTEDEAGRFATDAAALSVTRAGAQPSMPTRVELEAWHAARTRTQEDR